jgi:fatty acid desaturase
MAVWAFIIFLFGILLFLLWLFSMFGLIAPWILSVILFVIAFGMLSRIWTKEKEGEKEKLAAMVAELEERLARREGRG